MLVHTAAISGIALAGCLGGPDTSSPDPITLPTGADCDNCGMVIDQHPGPNGQLFYEENQPANHDEPFRYDALKQCFFPDLLESQQLGWTATGRYVTDYSNVEYTLQTDDDTTYISSHTGAASFAPAADMTYVVGSEVEGAMGPDFIPFSSRDDAEAFTTEHGGDLVAYDDIDEGLIGK